MKTYAIVNIFKKQITAKFRYEKDAEEALGTPKKNGVIIRIIESEESIHLPSDEVIKQKLGW